MNLDHFLETMENFRAMRADFRNDINTLFSIMNGKEKLIWPFMSLPDGTYSEERTREFIEQILDCQDIENPDFEYVETSDGEISLLPESIQQKQCKEILKHFLYCILRAVTAPGVSYHLATDEYFTITGAKIPSSQTTFSTLLDTLLHIDNCYRTTPMFVTPATKEKSYILESPFFLLLQQIYEKASSGQSISIENALTKLKTPSLLEKESKGIKESFPYNNPEDEWWFAWTFEKNTTFEIPCSDSYCKSFELVIDYLEENTFTTKDIEHYLVEGIKAFLPIHGCTIFGNADTYYEILAHIRKAIRIARKYTED